MFLPLFFARLEQSGEQGFSGTSLMFPELIGWRSHVSFDEQSNVNFEIIHASSVVESSLVKGQSRTIRDVSVSHEDWARWFAPHPHRRRRSQSYQRRQTWCHPLALSVASSFCPRICRFYLCSTHELMTGSYHPCLLHAGVYSLPPGKKLCGNCLQQNGNES
jgi:hypothetical protein